MHTPIPLAPSPHRSSRPNRFGRAAVLALFFAGCTGVVGDDADNAGAGPGATIDEGDPSLRPGLVPVTAAECAKRAPEPGVTMLRRLTREEYTNSVRDLLGVTDSPGDALPEDEQVHGFENDGLARVPSELLIERLADAAEKVASSVNLVQLSACNAESEGAAVCGARFIDTFAAKAYRHPLEASEREPLVAVFTRGNAAGGYAAGLRQVVATVLQSAPFLYRVELPPETAGSFANGHELASRLSFFLWGTTPDAELLDAAKNGKLSTASDVEAQARRLLASPRAHARVQSFHRQWLHLSKLDSINKNASVHENFPALRTTLKSELAAFVEEAFWNGPNMATLFDADFVFASSQTAGLYGVTASGNNVRVAAPAERRGLLAQPALLSMLSNENIGHPVLRGKFVREALLCQELPPPPPDVPTDVSADENLSTRERYAAHSASAACSGCHVLMDPIGFGFENYDAVGRYRTEELGAPVDARGELTAAGDANGAFNGLRELSAKLGSSNDVKSCVSQQWFRFAMGRGVQAVDSCSMLSLRTQLEAKGNDPRELLVAMTQTDSFLRKGPASPR